MEEKLPGDGRINLRLRPRTLVSTTDHALFSSPLLIERISGVWEMDAISEYGLEEEYHIFFGGFLLNAG